jgi:hypothetical protein
MLLSAAGTRYSLVKGERIVRYVPTACLSTAEPGAPPLASAGSVGLNESRRSLLARE